MQPWPHCSWPFVEQMSVISWALAIDANAMAAANIVFMFGEVDF
jgi:hypothetical protein